jgi:hypothetical protein
VVVNVAAMAVTEEQTFKREQQPQLTMVLYFTLMEVKLL